MQAYIQKLGTCLLAVDENEESEEADEALTKLSIEAASVVCCLNHFNVSTIKKLYQLRLDIGQPVDNQPGDAFYGQLVVSLSDRQLVVWTPTACCQIVKSSCPFLNHFNVSTIKRLYQLWLFDGQPEGKQWGCILWSACGKLCSRIAY